jgi:hypothetical protein
MAVEATLLKIPFNPRDLYECDDRSYLNWFDTVIAKVAIARKRMEG